MQTFSYATKDGKLKNFEASNENDALSRLSGFGDSAKNSGVMKARTLPQPKKNILAAQTLGTTNDTPKTTYSAFNPITNAQAEQDRILAQQQARAERNASQEINEDDIYRDQLAMFQKEIDATNQIYAQMMADQKIEGRGNLGSAGAIQARSGLLGSDFASGQNAEVTKQNREAESLISAQQGAAIAQIMGMARRSAVEEIARKRQAQQQGLQDYITYLGQSNERRASKVNALRDQLLQQGVKLEDIDPSTLNKILKDFGITKDEVALAYADEEVRRAQEAEVKRIEAEDKAFDRRIKSRQSLSPGEQIYEINPETGQMEVVASRPAAPSSLPRPVGPLPSYDFDTSGNYIGNDARYKGLTRELIQDQQQNAAKDRGVVNNSYARIQGVLDKYGVKSVDKLSKADVTQFSDADAETVAKALSAMQSPAVSRAGGNIPNSLKADNIPEWTAQFTNELLTGGDDYLPENLIGGIQTAKTLYDQANEIEKAQQTKNTLTTSSGNTYVLPNEDDEDEE